MGRRWSIGSLGSTQRSGWYLETLICSYLGPPHPNLLATPVGGVKSRELLPTMTKFMCPSSHSKEDSNYPNSKKKEQSDTFYLYCHVIMRF